MSANWPPASALIYQGAVVVAAGVVVVAVLGLAGLSWWQLQRYGSPLIRDAQGVEHGLVGGLGADILIDRLRGDCTGGPGPAFSTGSNSGAASWVSRSPGCNASIPSVVSLCRASRVDRPVDGHGDRRWNVCRHVERPAGQRRRLGQGSDVRVVLEQTGADERDRRAISEVSGVEAVSPVWVADTQVGATDAQAIVAPMARWGAVTDVPNGAADPAELADVLSPGPAEGIPLPTGAETVQVDVDWQVVMPPAAAEAIESEFASLYEGLSQQAGVPADEALAIALEGLAARRVGLS
ncbi:hypothetical protein [Ornithinimicrobium sp. INDO-MA30-4]|uniref:hypothetical protein n=1 Tax=Ornithinimicrobium sp. INDO-MA30-4 TaxID=2908651 RepID=UPI001F1CC383|nr:hypothetical protein [Ornithinimicrobium sp. INDO-MA30-4]UJH69690.1 hypothetical protein L0A91_10195 [Ornithinimicrobium sp. INDO-MA30-4]